MASKLLTDVQELFKTLQISTAETKVYLACLTLGNSSASIIARYANFPRSTTYLLLESLKNKGFITEIKEETKKMYSPIPPEKIIELYETKLKLLQDSKNKYFQLLGELNSIHQSQNPVTPKVRFYKGNDGLKTVLYDSLSANEILCLCQGSVEYETSLADDPQYLKDYIEQIDLRRIPTREILQDTPAVQEYQQKYKSPIHQIMIIPKEPTTSFGHVDKYIYGNKISYISHDNKVGIIIEDETLAEAEKSQFEILWKYYAN